jgi:hypothetical protein
MAKIDLDGDGKADVSISISQIITIAVMFASIIGSYYTLSAKIDSNEAEVKKLKYNEKEYTWKAQREVTFTNNGFYWTHAESGTNISGGTYIYLAIKAN